MRHKKSRWKTRTRSITHAWKALHRLIRNDKMAGVAVFLKEREAAFKDPNASIGVFDYLSKYETVMENSG